MNFLLATIVWVGTIMLKGLVLKILWGWFIVPLGVVAISIPQALGLSILIILLASVKPAKESKWEEIMANSIASSSIVLLFGYIFHLFM